MPPVDPSTLSGIPAPLWFIQAFRIIGFVLHSIPMHLWLAGLPIVLLLYMIGGRNGSICAKRLFKQFPIIMALGINLGVVPLLFIQSVWYKAFYPSTILLAVHWLSILFLLIIAYYGLYYCSFQSENPKKRWTILAGLGTSLCLLAIALIFSSVYTFMALPSAWGTVYEKTSLSGAVSGMGTYWRDPILYVRLGGIIGLGFITFAFWVAFDALVLNQTEEEEEPAEVEQSEKKGSGSSASSAPLASKMSKKEKKKLRKMQDLTEEEELAELEAMEREENEAAAKTSKKSAPKKRRGYQAWAFTLASCLGWIGVLIASAALWYQYYQFLPMDDPGLAFLNQSPWKYLPMAVLGSLALPILVLTLGSWRMLSKKIFAAGIILSEFTILGLFASTRQIIQNGQLSGYLDINTFGIAVEWSPLIVFLVVFAVAICLIWKMIRQMANA
ncbi:MAG: hypothetical protein Q4G69_04880 [Planctomycetia bacterium]|nr:hypothetical protein [Planctomycetia bacterium]